MLPRVVRCGHRVDGNRINSFGVAIRRVAWNCVRKGCNGSARDEIAVASLKFSHEVCVVSLMLAVHGLANSRRY